MTKLRAEYKITIPPEYAGNWASKPGRNLTSPESTAGVSKPSMSYRICIGGGMVGTLAIRPCEGSVLYGGLCN